LAARVRSRIALHYTTGTDARIDRPDHVRAGSSLAWFGSRLAVVQDDANFIGLVDPVTQHVNALTLPAGRAGLRQFDDTRGNKRWKLDLEACVVLPDGEEELLLAFGSGSTSAREHIVVVRRQGGAPPHVTVYDAARLYQSLRSTADFAGSELNIEGAAIVGDRLRLFQRGNGAPRGELRPVDATCDLQLDQLLAYVHEPSAPAPTLDTIVQYDLGAIGHCRLTFTDGLFYQGSVLYSASAEDSPDAVLDGPVAGAALGVIDENGAARWAPLTSADGEPLIAKVEGLLPSREHTNGLWIVVDPDDSHVPCELYRVELDGPWFGEAGSSQ
jgi:hypothetical protein